MADMKRELDRLRAGASLQSRGLRGLESLFPTSVRITVVNAGPTYDWIMWDGDADIEGVGGEGVLNRALPAAPLSTDDIATLQYDPRKGEFFFAKGTRFSRWVMAPGFQSTRPGPSPTLANVTHSRDLVHWFRWSSEQDFSRNRPRDTFVVDVSDPSAKVGLTICELDIINDGILRTVDSGRTWEIVHQFPVALIPVPPFTVKQAFARNSLGTLFCVLRNHRVLKSLDDGATWATAAGSMIGAGGDVILAVTPADTLIAAAVWLIYRSVDDGATWVRRPLDIPAPAGNFKATPMRNIGGTLTFYSHVKNGTTSEHYKHESFNDGFTWAPTLLQSGTGFYMPQFDKIVTLNSGLFFTICAQAVGGSIGNSQYACISVDGETGWTPIRSNLTTILDFFYDPSVGSDGRLLLEGSTLAEQEYSDDEGATWNNIVNVDNPLAGFGGLIMDFSVAD